jgi:hypothetical protein
MTTRSISTFLPRVSAPVIEINRYSGLSRTWPQNQVNSNCEKEMSTNASEMGLGCIRGTTLALASEAAAALVIYAAWELFRILH